MRLRVAKISWSVALLLFSACGASSGSSTRASEAPKVEASKVERPNQAAIQAHADAFIARAAALEPTLTPWLKCGMRCTCRPLQVAEREAAQTGELL